MKIHPDCERLMFTEEQLRTRVREIAEQVDKVFADKRPLVVGILKGSIIFCCELAKRLTIPVLFDFMQVSSYGKSTESSGHIIIKKELDEPIKGDNVLIIEDIVDSGNTLSKLLPMLKDREPKSLKVCTLLDKPERRTAPVDVDYNGFCIPDEFVVGFGLDYNQNYRNLPYVGVLHFD